MVTQLKKKGNDHLCTRFRCPRRRRPQGGRAAGRSQKLVIFQDIGREYDRPERFNAFRSSARLDADTEPQPDALLRIEEVASSTASYDLHDKLEACRHAGVKEYLVWRVDDGQIDWFALHDGDYVRLTSDESGVTASRVFPGLRLAQAALLAGDMASVVAELHNGLGTAEHAAFVAQLG